MGMQGIIGKASMLGSMIVEVVLFGQPEALPLRAWRLGRLIVLFPISSAKMLSLLEPEGECHSLVSTLRCNGGQDA